MALANLATMTTLGNPMGAPALVPMAGVGPDGTPQIPTGKVETESRERKIMGPQTEAAVDDLRAGRADELKAKQTLKDSAIQLEGMDARGADDQAKVAKAKSDALDKLEEDRSKWRARREAELATELAEFKKVQNVKTMYQDASPLRKFASAIAIGAGAYASKMNGGPNDAFEIYKEQEDNFRRAQEANLKRQVEKMQASGKAADEILKYFDQGHKQIDMTFSARNDLALKQVAAVKATVPQAAARADEAMAQLRQRGAELDRNFVTNYDEEKRSSEQTSSGDNVGKTPQVDASTKQAVITARETAKSMNDLGNFIKANPKAWQEYQKAAKEEAELEAAKQGNEKLISSLQGIGAAKVSIDQRLKTPEARKINAMVAPMITAKAREMDPIGALNKDAYINASRSLNIFTGPPKEISEKAYEYGDKNQRIADEYVRMTPALQAQEAAAQPTGKVGSPIRARAIPLAKQEAAISAADDYVAVRDSVKSGKVVLTPNEKKDIEEALGELKKDSTHAEAAKFFRQLRQRKGI